jgi:hypothetical protein
MIARLLLGKGLFYPCWKEAIRGTAEDFRKSLKEDK